METGIKQTGDRKNDAEDKSQNIEYINQILVFRLRSLDL